MTGRMELLGMTVTARFVLPMSAPELSRAPAAMTAGVLIVRLWNAAKLKDTSGHTGVVWPGLIVALETASIIKKLPNRTVTVAVCGVVPPFVMVAQANAVISGLVTWPTFAIR